MENQKAYQSLLCATSNTRELGGCPAPGGIETVRGRIWRSDAPTARNEADFRLLKHSGMTTIVDLRTRAEAERKPCAYAGELIYRHFPIVEGSVPPAALADVPASYMQIALSQGAFGALRAIARADGGVLVCCTAGKDRTGVVSALLLLCCGVDDNAIVENYVLSREYNKARLEQFLAEHPEVDRQVVLANEVSMIGFLAAFKSRFASMESYFSQPGLSPAYLRRIREKLLGPAARA